MTIVPSGSGSIGAAVGVDGRMFLYSNNVLATGTTTVIECNQVVNAGETIHAYGGGGSVYFMISGFLLSELPAP